MGERMKYRLLGNSNLRVSAVGFGCWEMAGDIYGHIDQDEVVRAIHQALDLGVTLFDTAPGYGNGRSEALLGQALRTRRAEAVITTKCGQYWSAERGFYRDSSRATILRGIDESLRRLQTEYVDLLLIHWPDTTHTFDEAMGALNEAVQAGKARYLGVSNFRAEQLRACAPLAPLIANQVGYNLFDRRWEREMFATAGSLGIGIMAYGPLAHGLLTGTFTTQTRFEPSDWRSSGDVFGQPLLAPENFGPNLQVVERLKALAQELGTTLPRLSLAWVLQNPLVGSALSGTRRTEEIEENVAALDLQLTAHTMEHLAQIMAGAAGQTDQVPT
jgi:aryl-alcohol dehydrogenase-like predicted oxidoreductase